MPMGEIDPAIPWSDAHGFMPWLAPHGYNDLDRICTQCGARLGEHFVGGPGSYYPVERASLWFWNDAG